MSNNNNNNKKELGVATLSVHAGQEQPDPATGARATPIYQTASYVFKDAEEAAGRFALTNPGQIYSRLTNPTSDAFEARIAAVEGGKIGISAASGLAAISYALLNITLPGDDIVSADNLYGGTYTLFESTFKELARNVIFVPSQDLNAFEEAITPKTKAIYVESIGNPKLDVPDFEKLAEIAHSHNIPLIVDNTSAVGLVQPLKHGADINKASESGASPLYKAVSSNSEPLVKLLLAYGAHADQQDLFGVGPLHLATCLHNHTIAQILLGHGAEVNQQTASGTSPIVFG